MPWQRQRWRPTTRACFRSSAAMSTSSHSLNSLSSSISLYRDQRPQEIRRTSLSDPRVCRLENVSSQEEFSTEIALLVVSSWLLEGRPWCGTSTRHCCKHERCFNSSIYPALIRVSMTHFCAFSLRFFFFWLKYCPFSCDNRGMSRRPVKVQKRNQ